MPTNPKRCGGLAALRFSGADNSGQADTATKEMLIQSIRGLNQRFPKAISVKSHIT
jgi:hypothetical protein